MANESGAARAKYREASEKEIEHLAKHMSVHFADDEIRISFGVSCGHHACPLPQRKVTVSVSPESVKLGPHSRNYKEAEDGSKESEHLKKHLRLHLDHESHEVRLGYGIGCEDKKECIFPQTDVTMTVCPYYPCKP